MEKKVLLFAEHFAPESTPEAVRPTKLAKFLTKSGYSVTVVTKRQVAKADELLRQDLGACGRVYRAALRKKIDLLPPMPDHGKQARGQSLLDRFKTAVYRIRYSIRLRRYSEAYGKAFAARLMNSRAVNEHFDFVISTDLPLSGHLAALEYKKAHPDVFWVADFCRMPDPSDPGLRKFFRRRLYRRIIKLCGVCTVADQNLKQELERFSQRRVLVRVIPQGYDPEDFQNEIVRRFTGQMQEANLFRILWVCDGACAENDVSVVFRAIGELVAERRMDREKIAFDLCGDAAFAARIREVAGRFELDAQVRDLGVLSRARVLASQKSAQLAIACASDTPEYHSRLPLHLYEQIGVQKPALGLAFGEGLDSELYLLIKECRIGFCYEQSEGMASFEALKKYLSESYLYYFTRAKELYEPDMKHIARYSYENLITVWKELLEDGSF